MGDRDVLRQDENGYYKCPLSWCDDTLHLVWTVDVPLSNEVEVVISPREAAEWHVTDGWEVVCEGGHKVADSQDGNDYARPFLIGEALPMGDAP